MSLEATHLRFALAIKEDLGALDMEKYVAGVIYPDSRYVTGINRNLTHDLRYFEGRRTVSDFEKGWLAHIIGDKIFKEVTEDRFGDLVLFEDLHRRWAVVTAIKIVQDIEDFLRFDIQSVIGYLDYYELHFHEDERKVVEYNRIILELYQGKESVTVDDCLRMWEKFGIGREDIAKIRQDVIMLHGEPGLAEKINGNFEEGMDLYADKYRDEIAAKYKGNKNNDF